MQKIWLISCAFMVVLMVFVGGLTRLTDSGLSIVEWKPITGILPPLNQRTWGEEFSSYKTSPEYQKLNKNFTLEDFKNIFWLEFIHRILGRITGLIIIIPAIFFGIKKQIKNPMPYIAMCLLVILQGAMGWYMVKSGLVDNPHVSHYRLAMHLIMAILLYSVILWQIFQISQQSSMSYSRKPGSSINNSPAHLRRGDTSTYPALTLFLIYIQIFLGGLVAGLDAGLIYNEYPMMGGNFVPHEFKLSTQLFNDPVSVQFLHRIMAYIVVFSSSLLSYKLLKHHKYLAYIVIAVVVCQFLLGIFTLLYIIPIKLALAHQLFAVLLLSVILYVIFQTKGANHE